MKKEEKQLIVDVSVLYYLEGKTQNEIAKKLYLSRPKVSRLLKKARELQIVDITINYQNEEFERLQSEIKRKFNIENVVIARTLSTEEDTLREVGKVAAKKLNSELKPGMNMGISWGKNVRMMTEYLKKNIIKDLNIIELFGSVNYDVDVSELLSVGHKISSKLGAKFYTLPAPVYVHDQLAKKAITETPLIRSTLSMIEKCNLIVSGIGSIQSNSIQTVWDNYVTAEMKQKIVNKGGVGFICAHYFDQNGNFLDIDINDNVIGIGMEAIKQKRNIIIGAGIEKAKAILGVLRGGYVNVIISDEQTLKKVLKYSEKI